MLKQSKEESLPPIKSFNDHQNCKGHENFMLDCEYTKKDERNLIKKCINNYISQNAR